MIQTSYNIILIQTSYNIILIQTSYNIILIQTLYNIILIQTSYNIILIQTSYNIILIQTSYNIILIQTSYNFSIRKYHLDLLKNVCLNEELSLKQRARVYMCMHVFLYTSGTVVMLITSAPHDLKRLLSA